MHDTTLQLLDIRAVPVEEGDEHLVILMLTGIQTPFAGPDGQPVALVTGAYRVPLSKHGALEFIKTMEGEVEKLPDPKPVSNLVIPGSMNEAEQIANHLRKFN